MDNTTLKNAKDELGDRLVATGRQMDKATDAEEMRLLVRRRKQDQAALAVLRAVTPVSVH